MKKLNLSLTTIALILPLVFCFGFWTRAAQVEVQPDFYEQYKGYLKELPPPNFLNGKPSKDMEPVVPLQQKPFSLFEITLNDSKAKYTAGERLNITANLNYQFKGGETVNKIKEGCLVNIKDKNLCDMPAMHKIPELNDLGVLVQVWKKDQNEISAKKGDFLVDEFYALRGESLKIGGNKDFNIIWPIPNGQARGDYYLAIYLNQNKSFDLLGTPLAPFSEGKRFDFEIENENPSAVEIDKNNLSINRAQYVYRAPAPKLKTGPITVIAPLANIGRNVEQTDVKYELYRWSSADPSDLIDTKTESKLLNVSETANLSYNFQSNSADSVYALKITANSGNSKSTTVIRFIIEGKNRGIFRFLSLVEDKGKLVPMFCGRNANWDGEFAGKVKLALNGQSWEKEGKLAAGEGNCFLVKDDKMQLDSTQCGELQGTIFDQNGEEVDTKKISVNCKAGKADQGIASSSGNIIKGNRLWFGILAVLVIVIASGGIVIYLNNKKNKITP